MNRKLISSGSTFEAEIGYSREVVQGDWVFVSGATGFDYATMTISDDVEQQSEQCLRNIESALVQAGSSLADVVRVTYVLPDGGDFPKCCSGSTLRGVRAAAASSRSLPASRSRARSRCSASVSPVSA